MTDLILSERAQQQAPSFASSAPPLSPSSSSSSFSCCYYSSSCSGDKDGQNNDGKSQRAIAATSIMPTTLRSRNSSSSPPSILGHNLLLLLLRRTNRNHFVLVLVLLLQLSWVPILPINAALSCDSDDYCKEMIHAGSRCLFNTSQTCSNPYQSSCLATRLLSSNTNSTTNDTQQQQQQLLLKRRFFQLRVCNSDDRLPDAIEQGICYQPDFIYPEIRIHNGNWESSIFISWIMQILLMEVVQVPVTIGLGGPNDGNTTQHGSFYNLENTLAYSSAAYPFDALEEASIVMDCRLSKNTSCSQVLPEVWNGQLHEWTTALQSGYIDPIEGNGQVGKGSWYVPAFTAKRDDTLVSFYGLRGEANRAKLANAFRRPTTWKEYCEEVSSSNCTNTEHEDEEAEVVAWRYPTPDEEGLYYAGPNKYLGHFRLTEMNNCTLYPKTCAGHIIGPPCTWSTNVDGQLYWNDITLIPDGPIAPNGGYDYGSMIGIWRAANATQSNVMFWWWRPDALIEEFVDTSSQFQQILLPEATDTCSRSRVDTIARCSEDIMERRGSPEGACDQEAHALQKIFARSLREQTQSMDRPIRSPGYDLLQNIKITDLEVNNMIRRWLSRNVDKYGHDAREAVCDWVVDNLDALLDFIPDGYPRILSHQSKYDTGFLVATKILAGTTGLIVFGAACITYYYRKTRVFIYTQLYFCWLILFGFLMISMGSIVTGLEPCVASCTSRAWLITLGYTIELVPLLVKIAAINKILQSAKKMRRVQIKPRDMLKDVAFVVGGVVIFLLVWTIWDPPKEHETLRLESEQSQIVFTSLHCSSSRFDYWYFISLAWQALLLLMASVLAFQSRDVMQEFNESRSLGTMVYSHFLFVLLRSVLFFLGRQSATSDAPTLEPNVVAAVSSVLLSLDTLFALVIYMLPKFLEAKKFPEDYDPTSRNNRPIMTSGPRVSAAMSNISMIESRAAVARQSYIASQQQRIGSDPTLPMPPRRINSEPNPSNVRRTSGPSTRSSAPSSGGGSLGLFSSFRSSSSTNTGDAIDTLSPLDSTAYRRASGSLRKSQISVVRELSCEESDLSSRSLGVSEMNHKSSSSNSFKPKRSTSFKKNKNENNSFRKLAEAVALQEERSLDDPFQLAEDDDEHDGEDDERNIVSRTHDDEDDNVVDPWTGSTLAFDPMHSARVSALHASVRRLGDDVDIKNDLSDSDEEDYDVGGPRWSKPELNGELNRSVRSMGIETTTAAGGGGSGFFSHFLHPKKRTSTGSSAGSAPFSLTSTPRFNPQLPVIRSTSIDLPRRHSSSNLGASNREEDDSSARDESFSSLAQGYDPPLCSLPKKALPREEELDDNENDDDIIKEDTQNQDTPILPTPTVESVVPPSPLEFPPETLPPPPVDEPLSATPAPDLQENNDGEREKQRTPRALSPARERKRLIESQFLHPDSQVESVPSNNDVGKEEISSTEPSSSGSVPSQEFVVPAS